MASRMHLSTCCLSMGGHLYSGSCCPFRVCRAFPSHPGFAEGFRLSVFLSSSLHAVRTCSTELRSSACKKAPGEPRPFFVVAAGRPSTPKQCEEQDDRQGNADQPQQCPLSKAHRCLHSRVASERSRAAEVPRGPNAPDRRLAHGRRCAGCPLPDVVRPTSDPIRPIPAMPRLQAHDAPCREGECPRLGEVRVADLRV